MTQQLDHGTVAHGMQPEDTPGLRALYQGFKEYHLNPLWTQLGDLMPMHPAPKAVPHVWRWSDLLPLAEKSTVSAPNRRAAILKLVLVRVEFSKNRFASTVPFSTASSVEPPSVSVGN